MKKRPKHILPIIVALILATLLAFWVRYEWDRQRAAAYDYLRRIAHTVLTAMQGTIQAEMQRGGMRRARLQTIMNGIQEETDIQYLALVQGEKELVAAGTVRNLPQLSEAVGDTLINGHLVCWCHVPVVLDQNGRNGNKGRHLGQLKNHESKGRGRGMGKGRRRNENALPAQTSTEDEDESGNLTFTKGQRFVIAFNDAGYRRQLTAAREHLTIISVVAGLAIIGLAVVWIISARGEDLKNELRLAGERDQQFKEFELAAFGLAHETRHPLGVIRASAKQIADSEDLDQDHRRRALDIVEEADVATARMGEFMNYAKMKKPSMETVQAKALLENLSDLLGADFADVGIAFEVKAADLNVSADRDMFQRLVLNLVTNSLQACDKGDSVTVTLDHQSTGAQLTVADTGSGIPDDIRDTVFQPYVTGRAGGHGIGLAMVRKIAMEHGWDLDLKTDEAEGTIVTVSGMTLSGGHSE